LSESPKERYARLKTLLLEGGFAPALDLTRAEEGAGPTGEVRRAHEEAVLYVRDFEAILDEVGCTQLERQVMISRWLHYQERDTRVLDQVAKRLGLDRRGYQRIYERVRKRIRRHWVRDTEYQLGESTN
jgi:hypothetical protein